MKLQPALKSIPILLILAMTLCSCGGSSSDSPANSRPNEQKNRVNWEAIPSEFNPDIITENFQIGNSNRIEMDMFSFSDDVEVVYLDTLAAGQGSLKIYTVLKESGSRGSFSVTNSANSLKLNRNGSYSCSIQIKNGAITQLKGLCFIRLQVFLPKGSEIEVYNLKKLITRRYNAIDTETFLKCFADASFKDEKNAVIDDYLASYQVTGKTPQLTASQLGAVISGFMIKEDKFAALKKLHSYASDRQNLKAMIEKEFSFFDQDEAKRICGV